MKLICPYCESEHCICEPFDKLISGRKRNFSDIMKQDYLKKNLEIVNKLSEELKNKPMKKVIDWKEEIKKWEEKVKAMCPDLIKYDKCAQIERKCNVSWCPKYKEFNKLRC